jgi:hypothetical protein
MHASAQTVNKGSIQRAFMLGFTWDDEIACYDRDFYFLPQLNIMKTITEALSDDKILLILF